MSFPNTKGSDFSLEIPETPGQVFAPAGQQLFAEQVFRALQILRLQVQNALSASGDGGSGELSGVPLFIQDAQPTTDAEKYVWIQTNAGAAGAIKIWVEDGT
jgi:hypothetical protein